MKVALVHDWLVSVGGAENFLHGLHVLFPEAPIYTLVYNEKTAPKWTKGIDIRTTKLQKFPFSNKLYKNLLTMMPKAWEELDLTEYDLIISSCSSFCKSVITRNDAIHICYCHSPIRYVWDQYYEYMRGSGLLKRFVFRRVVQKLRILDYIGAQRVDYFVANAYNIAKRIKKFYNRDAEVIYSGCRLIRDPLPETYGDYYLIVSRLVYYKRVDLAVEACTKLNKNLIVVGTGGEEKKLRKIAGSTVTFKGFCSDEEIKELYLNAKAFLFPGNEDFGLTPIEAQSAGIPVLAYGKGGILETVIDEKTGMLFHEQTAKSLMECIKRFEEQGVLFNKEKIRKHSEYFSQDRFNKSFLDFIASKLKKTGIDYSDHIFNE